MKRFGYENKLESRLCAADLLNRYEMVGFWSKNRGGRTYECGSFPWKLFFAKREDLPSAFGERGNVCEFVGVVSIENEGIAIVQRQLGGFPFARCVLPPIFRWRIYLIAPATVDRNIQAHPEPTMIPQSLIFEYRGLFQPGDNNLKFISNFY